MVLQTMQLDPNAQAYTDNEIVQKVNAATIGVGNLASGVAKANLDSMNYLNRGYIQTSPITGEFPIIALQRTTDGKLDIEYDDVPK